MTGKAVLLALAMAMAVTVLTAVPAAAQELGDPLITPPPATPEVYSLQDMMHDGGVILWVIMALGFVTLVMTIYLFFTVTPRRETPESLFKRVVAQIRGDDIRGAFQMCEGRKELLPKVVIAGLKVHGHDRYVIQEAMESEGERGATALWQRISYLNNAGVIAPLLGLLGTVWGMIGAFSAIASDNAQVKGIAMASKVSQAMITTAAGLVLAIPAMMAYFYLRGRVTRIVAEVEAQATEIVELLSRGEHA
jgi:biopolymer transport protein ExbB